MSPPSSPSFLRGGGRAGEAARAVDWAATSLGPPDHWPQSLQTMAGVILASRHPMFLWWGPELIQIYNDAYLPSFGDGRHPAAMGQRGRECWPETWPLIGPLVEAVFERAEPCWFEDARVPIHRNGRIEEVYWTYGYSPVYEGEAVAGVLVVCTETTQRVLAERRQRALRSLGGALSSAAGPDGIVDQLLTWLPTVQADVPSALRLVGGEVRRAFGLDEHEAVAFAEALALRGAAAGLSTLSTNADRRDGAPGGSAWWIIPLDPQAHDVLALRPSGALPMDLAYEGFFAEAAELLRTALIRVRAVEAQRELWLQAPVATAVLTGPDFVFELANRLFVQLVDREVRGRPCFDVFPELRDGPIPALLAGVYERGEPFVAHELPLPLGRRPDGSPEPRFFRFSLEPLRDAHGAVYGVMAVALDVTEQVMLRTQAEERSEERAKLLADARTASRAKDEFLAVLGHELRNPLAPILTALGLMELSGVQEGARERAIIARQAQHLTLLVDDMLDVSRVAQGKIVLKRTRVSVAAVVAAAIEIASDLLESKGHELSVSVPDDLAVDADELRLRQVIANLLTNAARYTPPGGHVLVAAERLDDEIVLRVADDGKGIDPTVLPHLFGAFFQGPGARDHGEGGLGLGLALVKALTELHGGTVSLDSPGPGLGTVAELRLRAAPLGVSSQPPRTSSSTSLQMQGRPRVLLVDDNIDLVELFAALLTRRGFDVEIAHDGPSALAIAQATRPLVAVLDIGLPVMDGLELARRLRDSLGASAPRLIAMSGFGQERDREKSLAAGFDEHLVKPVAGDQLVLAIVGALGRA